MLSPYQQNKLQEIREAKDPSLRLARLMTEFAADRELLKAFNNLEKYHGRTPVKGQDYFTSEEIDTIVKTVQALVKDGKPGEMGPEGKIGEQGPEGKMGRQGIQGLPGTAGKEGRRGLQGLPGVAPTAKEVALELKKIPFNYEDIKNAPDLTDLPKLIAFLKAGGFRGGGSSTTGATSGFQRPISGIVDGVNQTFGFATAPNVLVADEGRQMQKVSTDGTVNWTGTTTVILSVSPNFDLFSPA